MSAAAFDVVVIGGGSNGLVAAATLAKAGRRVVVLERGETLGGQRRILEFAPGFRAAPLGLDPGWLPDSIARALSLESPERAVQDAALTVPIEPGRFLSLSRDPARAADAIRAHSPRDAAAWPAFTARLRALAGFLEALYQVPAPDIDGSASGELLPLVGLARRFRALGKAHMIELMRTLPMSVWELLDDAFECGPLKAAVAAGGIQDHRQGPRSGGTGFVLLHHLVGASPGSVRGRAPWRQGPDAFTAVAERAARRLGATLRTGAAVAAIRVRDDAVAGVTLEGGEEIDAAAVLSTADPKRTLLDWVDPVWLDPEFAHAVRNLRYRGCTAVVLYALDGLPEASGLAADAWSGKVTLTSSLVSLERAADAAKYGTVSERPHVELTVPTQLTPGLAPDGKHVMVARVQYAPYALAGDASWDAARTEALGEAATRAIAEVVPGFAARVLHRVAWSPRDLEQRYGLGEGAVSQGELALDQILFMRPVPGWGRHATPLGGLYLGGVGTHPGPGILGGAGWLAARRLLDDRARG